MQTGGSAHDWARAMLDTLAVEAEQRAMLDARLHSRKRATSVVEEWRTPMMSENDT
jgi:hypothetical protein